MIGIIRRNHNALICLHRVEILLLSSSSFDASSSCSIVLSCFCCHHFKKNPEYPWTIFRRTFPRSRKDCDVRNTDMASLPPATIAIAPTKMHRSPKGKYGDWHGENRSQSLDSSSSLFEYIFSRPIFNRKYKYSRES